MIFAEGGQVKVVVLVALDLGVVEFESRCGFKVDMVSLTGVLIPVED